MSFDALFFEQQSGRGETKTTAAAEAGADPVRQVQVTGTCSSRSFGLSAILPMELLSFRPTSKRVYFSGRPEPRTADGGDVTPTGGFLGWGWALFLTGLPRDTARLCSPSAVFPPLVTFHPLFRREGARRSGRLAWVTALAPPPPSVSCSCGKHGVQAEEQQRLRGNPGGGKLGQLALLCRTEPVFATAGQIYRLGRTFGSI